MSGIIEFGGDEKKGFLAFINTDQKIGGGPKGPLSFLAVEEHLQKAAQVSLAA